MWRPEPPFVPTPRASAVGRQAGTRRRKGKRAEQLQAASDFTPAFPGGRLQLGMCSPRSPGRAAAAVGGIRCSWERCLLGSLATPLPPARRVPCGGRRPGAPEVTNLQRFFRVGSCLGCRPSVAPGQGPSPSVQASRSHRMFRKACACIRGLQLEGRPRVRPPGSRVCSGPGDTLLP